MKRLLIASLLLSLTANAKAVKVDEVLTDAHKYKLEFGLNYSNIQSQSGVFSVQNIQTSNGDFVTLPIYMGDKKSIEDYVNYSLTLRYGFSKKLELFSSVNLYYTKTSVSVANSFRNSSSSGLNSINLGATYQIKDEDTKPSLLVGFSATALEKTKFNDKSYSNSFKTLRVYATSYYTVDPVVFLLNTSCSINFSKKLGDNRLKGGNIFSISPQIYFAVNPYTSLNWGVRYTHKSKVKLNGKAIENSSSSVAFLMGASYELSNSIMLNIDAQYSKTNSNTQSSISTTISYKF